MRAALRDAKRQQAKSANLYPHISVEEQARLRADLYSRAKNLKGMSRRRKMALYEQAITECLSKTEAMRAEADRKVQPGGGLLVPQKSLLVTPDEVRRMAQVRR